MAVNTNIEWCDATLNLWWGCTKVSDGCKFCYAEHLSDQRFQRGAWGPGGTRQEVKSWRSTLAKISKRAKDEGRRLRVFCQSMSDTFEGPETCGGTNSENWKLMSRLRMELFRAIMDTPNLDWLLLTKRPENIKECIYRASQAVEAQDTALRYWVNEWMRLQRVPHNVWLGTSVEDQATAIRRIPSLLSVPAAVRFLSCEPLLGMVDLAYACFNGADSYGSMPGVHWVICGGESGPNARPMNPEWVRSLRDQCVAANVPFVFKQWGEWLPGGEITAQGQVVPDCLGAGIDDPKNYHYFEHPYLGKTWRVGKKTAGRILGGRTWDQFPKVAEDVKP